MGKYFGTDGVRGIANRQLTAEMAYRLGRFGGYILTKGKENPRILVGRDTRISGPMLEHALLAGLMSVGIEVMRLGVISTPGVAYLTRALDACGGIMISASHNPYSDNGIKFFGPDGYKLSDAEEASIEALLDAEEDQVIRPTGDKIGTVIDYLEGVQKYLQYLKTTVDHSFEGLKIVVDCANGSASSMALHLLADLGADVVTIGCSPNGTNINDGVGSTHPERLQEEVMKQNANLGLAFDGDADRLIAVDHEGKIVDGDHIMAICAIALKEREQLKQNTLAATVMSNLGLFEAMKAHGIETVQTKVGDRYVMEALRAGGFNLGGEQSGHIIFLDYATTGDGLLTAIQLVNIIQEKKSSLSKLAEVMTQYPQILVNVKVKEKQGWEENATIQSEIEAVKAELGNTGRLLVRPSGTEALIRVMAEGPDEEQLKQVVNRVADAIRRELA